MRCYYDFEFLEDGLTIEMISIGIKREDGKEYYAVNADMPIAKILRHDWLMEFVWPHLPTIETAPMRKGAKPVRSLNVLHSAVKPFGKIATEVHRFLTADGRPPELWAYYAAYDHVRLMQLWGPMVMRPSNIPMWTNDLRQEMHRLGITAEDAGIPGQANLHKAIDDARWDKELHEYLIYRADQMGRT